ncbi:hypothetical protein EDB84DRAFT_1441327, partial [Lactarius hengduanensis]
TNIRLIAGEVIFEPKRVSYMQIHLDVEGNKRSPIHLLQCFPSEVVDERNLVYGKGLGTRTGTGFQPRSHPTSLPTARCKPMVPPPPFGCAQEPPSPAATRLHDCDTEPHATAVTACRTLQHDGALHATIPTVCRTLQQRWHATTPTARRTGIPSHATTPMAPDTLRLRLHAVRYDSIGVPHYESNGVPYGTTPTARRTLQQQWRAAHYESNGVPHATTPTTARRALRQQRRAARYDTDVGAPHATTATACRTLRHRRHAACYDSDAASHATTPPERRRAMTPPERRRAMTPMLRPGAATPTARWPY